MNEANEQGDRKPGVLGQEQVDAALVSLPDWRHHDGALSTVYKFGSSADAISFIADVGAIAEAQVHHPDLDWRYNKVFLTVSSHDAGGQVTNKDVDFAMAVSAAAQAVGAKPQPGQ